MGLLSRKTKRDCLSGTGVELRGRHYWQQWLAFILSSLVYIPSRLVYVRRLICAEYSSIDLVLCRSCARVKQHVRVWCL